MSSTPGEVRNAATEGGGQGTAVDPVCGMTVDLARGKPSHEHDGVTYHFCCEGCRTKFVADPERYLKADARQGHDGHR